jgi:hypothetical protein
MRLFVQEEESRDSDGKGSKLGMSSKRSGRSVAFNLESPAAVILQHGAPVWLLVRGTVTLHLLD